MVIELVGPRTRLMLSGQPDWCEIRLETEDREVELGADSAAVVLERLASAVAEELTLDRAGEIDGLTVAWVASLSDQHTTIYVGTSDSRRVLFFQDADGKTFARVDLDDASRKEWSEKLRHARHGAS